MRPILAFAILLLGLSGAAPEPDYSRYFTDHPHAVDGGAASSLIEIESSTGRTDRLTVASLEHPVAVETLKPARCRRGCRWRRGRKLRYKQYG